MTKGANADEGVPPRTRWEVWRSFRLPPGNGGAGEDAQQQ
jgi:hypothetical protein